MIRQTPALSGLFLILSESQEQRVSILIATGYYKVGKGMSLKAGMALGHRWGTLP